MQKRETKRRATTRRMPDAGWTTPPSYAIYRGDFQTTFLTLHGSGPWQGEQFVAAAALVPEIVELLDMAAEAVTAPEPQRKAWLAGVEDVLRHIREPALLRESRSRFEDDAQAAAEDAGAEPREYDRAAVLAGEVAR